MIVSFVGCNGTGKTTLCATIAERLRKRGFKVRVRYEFAHFLLHIVTKGFAVLSDKTSTTDVRRMVLHSHKSSVYQLGLLPFWIDDLIAYSILKRRAKDSILLTDRYFYDNYVPLMMMGTQEKFFKKLYLAAPKPDVLVYLDVSPNTAIQRKAHPKFDYDPAFNISYYEEAVKCYREFAKELGVETVNTEQPLNIILDDVERRILEQAKIEAACLPHYHK